ncbi:MAG: hypothetical protein R3E53_08705 [Myxococcota bacterium]
MRGAWPGSALLDWDPLHGVRRRRFDRRAARREIERLASLPEAERESFVVDRLLRTLRHFAIRPRVGEVVEFLSGESRADEARVDASYALVRVCLGSADLGLHRHGPRHRIGRRGILADARGGGVPRRHEGSRSAA